MTEKLKKKLILTLCALPFLLSVVVHVVVINSLTIDGKKLDTIQSEITTVTRENQFLEYEKSQLGSADTVSKKSEELGMKPVEVSFFDNKPKDIALSR